MAAIPLERRKVEGYLAQSARRRTVNNAVQVSDGNPTDLTSFALAFLVLPAVTVVIEDDYRAVPRLSGFYSFFVLWQLPPSPLASELSALFRL